MVRVLTLGLLGALAGTTGLLAQVPAVPQVPSVPGSPTIPTVPGGTTPGATVPGVTAPGTSAPSSSSTQPSNIYSFLCPTSAQTAACQAKLCASPVGQILSAVLQPVSLYSGGIVGQNCCPQNNPNNQSNFVNSSDLGQPSDSALGAAARIQQDDAEASRRVQAVEYLSTVDSSRYPEAELALIASLRGDRNECVRLAAARGLQRGCACSKRVMEALAITISGSNRDGFPIECSPRVRAAATFALQGCLHRCTVTPVETETPPEPPVRPEVPRGTDKKPGVVQLIPASPEEWPRQPAAQAVREAQILPSPPAAAPSGTMSGGTPPALTPATAEPLLLPPPPMYLPPSPLAAPTAPPAPTLGGGRHDLFSVFQQAAQPAQPAQPR
jgi:hypothetical protein